MSSTPATITGVLPAELANAISDAISFSIRRGMAVDEAACVAVGVAADYARAEYGDEFLKDLAFVVIARASAPLPTGAS